MAESTEHDGGPGSLDPVTTTIQVEELTVEKTATLHGDGAVAVTIRLESARESPCEVRLVDPLPDEIRDNDLEFHPNHDPENWRRTAEAVIYEASLRPLADRTTVYGVVVDDPSQLERFAVEPTLEIDDLDDVFEYWAEDGPPDPAVSTSSPSDGAGSSERKMDSVPDLPTGEDITTVEENGDTAQSMPDATSDPDEADQSPHRPERGGDEDVEALRAEVEALRASVDAIQSQLAEIEVPSERLDTLGDDLAAVEERVTRLDHWQKRVQESIAFEPESD